MTNKEKTLKVLNDLGISYQLIEHNICKTMQDLVDEGVTSHGKVYKNLFLRNAKGNQHFVLSLDVDKEINIQDVAKMIGSTRLSFGSDERLDKHLKLVQGQVGPLSVINNEENTVMYIIDSDIKNEDVVGFHPNDNAATVFISFESLKKVFDYLGREITTIKL